MRYLKGFNEDLENLDYEEIVEEIKDILIDLKDEDFLTNAYYIPHNKSIYTALCRYEGKEEFSWNDIKDVINRLVVCFESNGLEYELNSFDNHWFKSRVNILKSNNNLYDDELQVVNYMNYFTILCR